MTIEQNSLVTQLVTQTEQASRKVHRTPAETPINSASETHARSSPGDSVTTRPFSAQDIGQFVDNLSELATRIDRGLEFRVDEVTGKTVVTVMDRETEEVIRQIPSEELLALAQRLKEGGGLIDELTG